VKKGTKIKKSPIKLGRPSLYDDVAMQLLSREIDQIIYDGDKSKYRASALCLRMKNIRTEKMPYPRMRKEKGGYKVYVQTLSSNDDVVPYYQYSFKTILK
jgi:hypothetical protein